MNKLHLINHSPFPLSLIIFGPELSSSIVLDGLSQRFYRLNHLTAYQSLAQELIDDLDGLSDEETGDAGEDATGEDTATATTTTTNGNGKRTATSPLRADQNDVKMDQDDQPKDPNQVQLQDGQLYVPTGGVRPADELDAEAVEGFKLEKVLDVRKVAPLTSSKRMKDVLEVSHQSILLQLTNKSSGH